MARQLKKKLGGSRRRFMYRLALGTIMLPWVPACTTRSMIMSRRDEFIEMEKNGGKLRMIEQSIDGRIGVSALDLSNGSMISYRGHERFAMCSTFKWILAGLILKKVDQQQEDLHRSIAFNRDDLVYYSPVTETQVDNGHMTIAELCHATMTTSDNTAANLLLTTLGGPVGFTAQLRSMDDTVTRLDRLEPGLNQNIPGDPRDTSTPIAMVQLMRLFLFGDVLEDGSKELLRSWMIDNKTGGKRLRAGIPSKWISGDRTGTSDKNASNNVAFSLPPNEQTTPRGPIIVTSFINAQNPFTAKIDAVHADIASHVYQRFQSLT